MALLRPPSAAANLRAWFCSRRVFFASRFAFAAAAVSIVGAKLVHIWAHREALVPSAVVAYGISFFTQDVVVVLLLRLLLDAQSSLSTRPRRLIAASFSSAIVATCIILASTSISFFLVAGTELHWRNVGVAGDSSAWAMLLSGLFSCSLTFVSILASAWLLQDVCFVVTNAAMFVIQWPIAWTLARIPRRWIPRRSLNYEHLPRDDVEGAASEPKPSDDDIARQSADELPHPRFVPQRWHAWLHMAVAAALLVILFTSLCRPTDSSLVFMSWTLPLMPVVDLINSSPSLTALVPSYGTDIVDVGNRSALTDPVPFAWLPKDTPLPGFEDWYENKEHYRAAADPLRISNLDSGIIGEIKSRLSDVDIRHVVLIKLESTRKDVFPIKKDGIIWKELAGTFKNKTMPDEAFERLATLTPTANFLTGDYEDGFEHPADKKPRRGGINANNVHTTSTYTLKSLFGTFCGLYPLVADFNVEQESHVYQPCLPHVFNAFNHLDNNKAPPAAADDKKDGDDFRTYN